MRNIILPPGRFFKPYSAYKDNHSLACYYTRIYRERNGEKEYPLSITISDSSLSIYWHGYQRRSNNDADTKEKNLNEDYGVHQIFSIDFNDLHKEAFEKWLSGKRLIPAEFINEHTYKVEAKPSNLSLTYSEAFYANQDYADDVQTRIFKMFILDFLFDVKYTNLFVYHPQYEGLTGFFTSIPVAKGIWLKSDYLLLLHENNTLSADKEKEDRKKFIQNKLQESGRKWLLFLRTKEMEPAVNIYKNWFDGVEIEHDKVYINSNADYLRSEAEDSVQWSLSRYDLTNTYSLQLNRVFSKKSRWLIGISFTVFTYITTLWLLTDLFTFAQPKAIFKAKYILLTASISFITLQLGRVVSRHSIIPLLILCLILILGNILNYGEYQYLFTFMFLLSTIILNILLSIAVERIIHVVIRPAMNFLLKKKYKWDPQRSFYDSLLSIPKIITIIKPKILLASGIVWTFLFASKIDILWSMDFKITPIKSALMLAIVISAYFFMMAKLSAVVIRPKGASKFIELTKRGVLVLILASTYSFIIGMLGMSYYAKKSLSDETRKMSYKTNYLSVFDTSSHALLWYPRSQNTNEKQLLVSRDLLCASLIRNNFHQKFDSLFFNTQLPNIYRDGTLNKKVCYSHNFNVPLEKDLPLTFFLFATTDPLIFFTFITVAVGILLEMGLRIEDTGINLD